MTQSTGHFQTANPHMMTAVIKAGESSSIVAALDIYDQRGTKLWAAAQAVTPQLRERLTARKLREPIERCLRAESGVTADELRQRAEEFCASSHPLAAIVKPHGDLIVSTVKTLDLHPVIGLLLTAARCSALPMFNHAVHGMCLAGAMFTHHPAAHATMKDALLGGLLHDIGNLYLHPLVLDDSQQEDLQTFRQIAVHPRIGRLLIEELTNYSPELALAIDEHHERLDGSGYPAGRVAESTSDLGKMLAVAEVVVSLALETSPAPISQARLALRFVTTEFDNRWTSMFLVPDATAASEPAAAPVTDLMAEVAAVDKHLEAAQIEATALVKSGAPNRKTAGGVALLTLKQLQKLRSAWAETGLWGLSNTDTADGSTDNAALLREMRYRMGRVRRDITMWSAELPENESERLYELRDLLIW